VVLYVHGGGFRILSKDTHWLFGLMFARRGYVVFNIDYRLAPKHPFPAAVQDSFAAYEWVVKNAAAWGGDPSRLVLAGESAGANLVTSLALSACYPRSELWARRVFEAQVVPRAVVAACGVLQVSNPERFLRRRKPLPVYIHDRLAEVTDAYFRGVRCEDPCEMELADPLLVLERGLPPTRPLPPFFAPCGTKDPLLDDTRRLAAALERMGTVCTARIYPGEMHAFHAFLFRRQARECWREAFAFLDQHV
jgi:acetyl esterase